jgi:hypothetical protein
LGDNPVSPALALAAEVKTPAAAIASKNVFFMISLPFFVCYGSSPLFAYIPDTAVRVDSLR